MRTVELLLSESYEAEATHYWEEDRKSEETHAGYMPKELRDLVVLVSQAFLGSCLLLFAHSPLNCFGLNGLK